MYKGIFKKIHFKVRKGSAALTATLLAAALTSIIGLTTVKLSSANLSAASITKISTQAEQYAKARAGLIRATKYDDLAASTKSSLSGTNFKIEVLKGTESSYSSDINQRTMTVNVYNGSDSSPIYSLDVPRFSKESGGSEVYITETWHSGSEGYRVWSDGFIEQWGRISYYSTNLAIWISFKKAFVSNPIYISVMPYNGVISNDGAYNVSGVTLGVSNVYNTGFVAQLHSHWNYYFSGITWMATGY